MLVVDRELQGRKTLKTEFVLLVAVDGVWKYSL